MSFIALLKAIRDKHLTPGAPKPLRTRTPLRLSQDAAVTISITPLILAEEAGALFKSDLPTDHKIIAVGQFSLFGLNIYHCYLSQSDGAFIHIATKGDEVLETLLYRQYDEVYPASTEDWAFWLADADGYIGLPVMQSATVDGDLPYRRKIGGEQRISPFYVVESLVDQTGSTTTMKHRMMLYSRVLQDPKLAEHLLVSAVETDAGASVNLWLGLDLAASDLTVFPAVDTPL